MMNSKLSEVLQSGKQVLIDCDGVLTDGTLTIDHHGEKMFKRFHTRDVRAIRELVYNGYEVVIVTADDWRGIYFFADKVGAIVHITRDKGELPYENYIAIGDDVWDLPMLRKARIAYAPVDANPVLFACKQTMVRQLSTKGGHGVVAEVVGILLGKS